MSVNIYQDLPKIIVVLSKNDHGPTEGGVGSAICPHCGADGRYVYTFMCADGTTRGAMRGCLSKFPRHRFALEMQRILDKEDEYKRKGWSLPPWDNQIRDAIMAFVCKEITEVDANNLIATAKRAQQAYRTRRFGRGRR